VSFRKALAPDGLWRFNEAEPDADDYLADSSGKDRKAYIHNWSGTTASMKTGNFGRYFQMNISNPSSEENPTLKVANDGTIFSNIGETIVSADG
jgi:hypothetical protein